MHNMELIRNAVAAAAKQFGAEEYELTITDRENTGVEALKKEISTVSYSRTGTMKVRCVVGGKSGYAASELVTPEAAAEIVETACENATIVDDADQVGLFPGSEHYETSKDTAIELPDTDSLKERALQLQELAYAASDKIIDGTQSFVSGMNIVRDVMNSAGLQLHYETGLVYQGLSAAVKEIVYEKNEMSLADLGKIMAANWAGHEKLRLRMFRSKRKWGNNDAEANALGAVLIDCYAEQLNGKPNSRGEVFLASGHCARQYIGLGKRTGATPDGRKAGEEMSKNLSPVMGVDTEGATALIATLSVSDVTKLPADYPLDVMLHPSVCAGDRGLMLMKTLVRQYHRNGGSVIQFTVFSAEELRDAQKHPEKYENLQVRVCGWNVRWNDMTKEEQDAYIRRAENIMR